MTFWQFANEHPGWVTLWLVIIAFAIPSVSYTRKVGTAKSSDSKETTR